LNEKNSNIDTSEHNNKEVVNDS